MKEGYEKAIEWAAVIVVDAGKEDDKEETWWQTAAQWRYKSLFGCMAISDGRVYPLKNGKF